MAVTTPDGAEPQGEAAATLRPEEPCQQVHFAARMLTKLLFIVALLFTLTPWSSPPIALALGLALGLTAGNPFLDRSRKASKLLLQLCVVALGFGMNLGQVLEAGGEASSIPRSASRIHDRHRPRTRIKQDDRYCQSPGSRRGGALNATAFSPL